MHELMMKTMAEQAALVRRGEISPVELTDAAIAAIEALNPALNAVVLPLFDYAREQARAVARDAPFAGVPLLLKDMLAECAGTPLTEASRFLQGYVSPRDSELVRRCKQAGFVVCGKTNAPEFAAKPTTEPELYGPTRNPWDLARSPGGSSGGAAAAVAAGMVAVAHANDGGGSIRIPAAVCGLVGLKPTRGRNPLGPDCGDPGGAGLICEHVVTRSVADTALMLDVTAGADAGAPYFPVPPSRPYAAEVGADPGRLRIAWSAQPVLDTAVHADCRAAVEAAARLCESLGHDVEEARPAVDAGDFHDFFTTLWIGMMAAIVRGWEQRLGRTATAEHFERHTWKMLEMDARLHPSDYLLALDAMQRFARAMAPFWDTCDVWLTPTLPEPPVPLGWFEHDRAEPQRGTERMQAFMRFTGVANATGQPAITLPLHWNAAGLPIGVQLMGRYGDEAGLLRLAAQLERAQPWAGRYPAPPA
ncbi:MAG: amidase [Gammaproteobacteria bacterium]|nr:amidase [Gammaproteobacteria bacterium]